MLDAADVLDIFCPSLGLQSIEVRLELAEFPIELPLPAVRGDCDSASFIPFRIKPEPLQDPPGPAVVARVNLSHQSSLSKPKQRADRLPPFAGLGGMAVAVRIGENLTQ